MVWLQTIKLRNKKVSGSFVGTGKYWLKSPSNMVLKASVQATVCKFAAGKSVLDAGAGRLAYRGLITQYSGKYVSTDFRRTHPDLDVVADIENLPFKAKSFAVIFCSQVLEHVPHPWKALSEFHRILETNGVAIITVPLLGYIHNAPYDFFRYTEFGLRSLAKDTNFKVVWLKPVGGLFCFLGMIRSTVLMPFFSLPVLGEILFWFNAGWGMVDVKLDQLTRNPKVFPLNYLVVLKRL